MSDATRCPLCGESNECGMAAGKSTCWCFTTSIPPEILERIPEAERGSACVCAKCAASQTAKQTLDPATPSSNR